ncbi:response regulator transcription factor [Actinoplanes sp. NPDC024001]|uniref:helix-turn-helix transcriptional regulator n=1 Tax=Actinoplanes sp. NPDC024001 TaxID=3154598 RepID=UPI0033FE4CAE
MGLPFTAWPRSPSARRGLLVAAVLGGCFLWAMIVFGLSFAMIERGNRQWWVIPLFGFLTLVVAVQAVRWVPPVGEQRRAAPVVTRALAEPLSSREMEVLRELAAGRSNREIAKALFVAPGTVKAHLNNIFRKLDASSRLQAVTHAQEAGLLDSGAE